VFLAPLRNLSGLKAFNLQLPHRMLSDLRGMSEAESELAVRFLFFLVNPVGFPAFPLLLVHIGDAYVE
jgi:hypothetical protein